ARGSTTSACVSADAASFLKPSSPRASRSSAMTARRNSSTSSCACARKSPQCAASDRQRWTSPGSRRAGAAGLGGAGLSLWDIAAGFVLMQEAGGMVIGLDKKDATKGSFACANTSLAPKLVEQVEGRIRKPAATPAKLRPA